MTHYDEHTLELFVLGSLKVSGQRTQIEEHLRECHGCRDIVQELGLFHAELAGEMQRRPVEDAVLERAVVRRKAGLEPYFEPFAPPAAYRPRSSGERIRQFVRRHPFISGSAGLLALAAAAMLLSLPGKDFRPAKDTNAATPHYNEKLGVLEIYNTQGDSLLWKTAINQAGSTADWLDEESRRMVVIGDLDGDGRNEVIQTVREIGESQTKQSALKVYDASGTLRVRRAFDDKVSYLHRTYYSPLFDPLALALIDGGNGRKDILVIANNIGRSPAIVYRLNDRGEVKGRYWHFGVLEAMLLRDLDGDGKEELLLGGENDTRDTVAGGECAAFAVLDPGKILGDTRATPCTGYDLPPSNAEIAYLTLPRTDLNNLFKRTPVVDQIRSDRPQVIELAVRSRLNNENFAIHYFLDGTLAVKEVRSNAFTDQLHAENVRSGKLTGTIDNAYLTRLKEQVAYWDGAAWSGKPVRVQRNVP